MHLRDAKVACEILDVGAFGIGLFAPREVAAGEFVRVVFRIGAANGPERLHQADGVVVVANPQPGGCRVGIQFTVIEGHVASQIHAYVSERIPTATRRTGEYAPMDAYPRGEPPRTGEFPPASDDAYDEDDDVDDHAPPVLVEEAATGTDDEDGPRGVSGLPIRGHDRDAPIDHELLRLYLDAIRTVDGSRKNRS